MLRRISRTAALSTSAATNSAATESPAAQPARAAIRPTSTASEPAKSLPKCSAFESSAALWKRRAVRSETTVRVTSIASTSPTTTNAYQRGSTSKCTQPASRATASAATPTLTSASTAASNSAARCSAFPCPYWCASSAGRPATPSAKNVSSAATRSVPECSASETRPSEPLGMPAASLSAIRAQAAPTETSAVRRCAFTKATRLEVAAERLLALDRLEQGLEVALAERARAVALDHLEEERRPVLRRLREDLEQVAVLVAVDEDPEPPQVAPRLLDLADAVEGVLVVRVRCPQEPDAALLRAPRPCGRRRRSGSRRAARPARRCSRGTPRSGSCGGPPPAR